MIPPIAQHEAAAWLLGSYVLIGAGVGWLALACAGYCEAGAALVDELRRRGRHE